MKAGTVTWITGLSGSGKTTLAKEWISYLRTTGLSTVLLDGDELRSVFGDLFNYTQESRLAASLHYSRLCKLLSDQGLHVVCSTISLFHQTQQWNKQHVQNYVEIYLKASPQQLIKRDVKNLYQQALNGTLNNVVGVDIPIEEPTTPDLTLDITSNWTTAHAISRLQAVFHKKFPTLLSKPKEYT